MAFIKSGTWLLLIVLAFPAASIAQDKTAKPFELGVEQRNYMTPAPEVQQYGRPQMVGVPKYAAPPKPVKAPKPPKLNAGIQTQAVKPALKAAVQRPVQQVQVPVQENVLPPQFLGRWQVLGSRSNVEAQPQYQQGIDSIFSATTANTWNIQGSPEQGYVLNTDSGVSTPLMVQTKGNTAILRYQHPIKNTMAQEALVMQLQPGGAQFDGLERISIVKQGEPQPRAKVTYKLIGHRQ
ncbi:MAG: hypothetical protein K2X27_10480 [Candidatus Obscuribacterales bacterium]|nr:hypothetical protein [Candidatus Obscuribacterales bacterium]